MKDATQDVAKDVPQDVAQDLVSGPGRRAPSPPRHRRRRRLRFCAARAEMRAQLGSSVAFGSGYGQVLPGVPRKSASMLILNSGNRGCARPWAAKCLPLSGMVKEEFAVLAGFVRRYCFLYDCIKENCILLALKNCILLALIIPPTC